LRILRQFVEKKLKGDVATQLEIFPLYTIPIPPPPNFSTMR